MRKIIKLPSFNNVAKGSTAVLNCPVGLTYDKIVIPYTGVTLEQMQNIELRINGRPIMQFTDAAQIDNINTFYGWPDEAGFLTLHFLRPWMANLAMQRLTALGTSDVSTMSLHIDIDAAAAAPELEATAHQSGATRLGSFVKVRSYPRSFATSGTVEIDNIPRSARISAIHLFKADVSKIELEMDSIKLVDMSKPMSEVLAKKASPKGRIPISAECTHVDLCLDGDVRHVLVPCGDSGATPPLLPAQDLRLRPTIDTPGLVDVVVEFLDGFGGL